MPLDKGFDYFYGIPASLNYGILAWFEGRHAKVPPTRYTNKKPNQIALSDYRIQPPYERQLDDLGTTNQLGVVSGKLEVAADFLDAECLTRFTDKAIEWIEHQLNDDMDKPFFLYLPYTSPHKPVIPIERFRGRSGAGAYGDFMMETDWHVGRILDLLDEKKLADNTIVIFTSDNGPENTWRARARKFSHHSNGIYREGKRSIYEGGHRVPMFVRWPALISPASVCTEPVCQTDLLATFAEMLGETLPDNAGEDSVSLYQVLQDHDASANRPPLIHHSNRGRYAIRHGKWKLVMNSKTQKRRELYDLDTDLSETTNVIEQHPEIESRLTDQITNIVDQGRTTPGQPQQNDRPLWDDLVWMKP
jgi:arylsulfatase A